VQGQKETGFPERVYVYNYRIFDKYREEGIEVISLAILTDEDKNWRPNVYCINRWGFKLLMEIPIVKIIDYKLDEEKSKELESSDNPMALVVKAQLKSSEVKKADDKKKSSIKWELIYQCYRTGYTKKQVETLLKFIDWIIKLPDEYQDKLNYEISKLEEEYKMPYVTSWERMAKKQGVKQGLKQGKLETAKELVKNGVDIDIIVKATGFTREEIEKLAVDVH
jgi:predicted transposase/invertase (TIGR01784 family)